MFISGNLNHYDSINSIPSGLSNALSFALQESTISLKSSKTGQVLGGNSSDKALLSFLGPRFLKNEAIDIVDVAHFNSTRKFSATAVKIPEVILPNEFPFFKSSQITIIKVWFHRHYLLLFIFI